MNKYQRQWEDIDIALHPARQAVGVKFLFTEELFEKIDADPLKSAVSYCNMIRMAGLGYNFKATLAHSGCSGGSAAVGLMKRNAYSLSGCSYAKDTLGLYGSLSTARYSMNEMKFLDDPVFGLEIRPLQSFTHDPDIVILVTEPYSVMRLLQGYSWHFGLKSDFRLSGLQALCSECTATPYMTDDINLSTLCAGTRYLCGWKDEEMALGIVYHKLEQVVDGLLSSLPATEPEAKKRQIDSRAQEKDRKLDVRHGEAYFLRQLKSDW